MLIQFISQAVAGCLTGWSLIVAVGPQNAFLLRQGLRRSHIGLVILICSVTDCVLIVLGNLGIGALVKAVPWLITGLRWAGVVYLVYFAIQSFRSAAKAEGLEAAGDGTGDALRPVVLTTLAITLLNPGVYLDTMALLGTLAHQSAGSPWAFSVGAAFGSVSWFLALGLGARALAPLVAKPRTWRFIDLAIGIIVLALALRLALGT